ncbi:hypothetical protein KCU62_g2645, partial [Aureobasidium sp. EXF-3399]
MNDTTTSRPSRSVVRAALTIVPWMLLVHNLVYLIFEGRFENPLAFSNSLGLGFLIIYQWAIKNGYIVA